MQNNILRDGIYSEGKKLITFSNVLNHNVFPLAGILSDILQIGQKEMGKPIEIEFAVELNQPKGEGRTFNVLQIRPIVENDETVDLKLDDVEEKDTIILCDQALGNGVIKDVHDFIYVKPESFDAAKSLDIATKIGHINDIFIKENKNYILVGPGRWGSADPWLGIPVKWPQISMARVIVESGLDKYRIDPSQGTHFFQNLTSFRIGYFTINPFIKDGYYDLDFLNKTEAFYEDEFVRHIRFKDLIQIEIDGKQNKGVIFKPECCRQ